MTRVESLRRAWARDAEHHALRWDAALQTGNADLARRSAAAYRKACRTLRYLRLLAEVKTFGEPWEPGASEESKGAVVCVLAVAADELRAA